MMKLMLFVGETHYEVDVELCNKCLAIVTDRKKHLEWHLDHDKRSWGSK